MNFQRRYERLIIIFILFVYSLLVAQKINLVTADLGRHLKNGEIILKSFSVPQTNYYSYTYPSYSFINHHWGSGVVFYLIHKLFGFSGLSVFFVILNLVTFFLFFQVARRRSSFVIAVVVSLFVIPVLVSRNEIRPEIFSYFFIGVFLSVLWAVKDLRISVKWLFLLPFLEFLWINLHIYFFFGFFLLGVFFLDEMFGIFKKARGLGNLGYLGGVLVLSAVVTLLNPAGLNGILYPLKIFGNYGYRLLENQSVWFLDKIIGYPPNLYFKICFGLLALSWIYVLAKNKSNFSFLNFIFTLTFSFLAWTAVRNFTLFGYFSLIIIAMNFQNIIKISVKTGIEFLAIFSFIILILFCLFATNSSYWIGRVSQSGIGLRKETARAVDFFREQNLKGPIFNNYDNGSFLIYYLYPKEKVFVDNRPEAYPKEFFEKTYVPMQENEARWREVEKEYGFNTIFFYRHDLTPWAQTFLVNRITDTSWAPVYVDDYSIIFLKRNTQNQSIIKKYKLPKEIFSVKK